MSRRRRRIKSGNEREKEIERTKERRERRGRKRLRGQSRRERVEKDVMEERRREEGED